MKTMILSFFACLFLIVSFTACTDETEIVSIVATDNFVEGSIDGTAFRFDPSFIIIPIAEAGVNYQLSRHFQVGAAIFPELSGEVEFPVRLGGQLRYNF